jgi:signal transduction histidine kinase
VQHEHERTHSQDEELIAGIPAEDTAPRGRVDTPAARDANRKQEMEAGVAVATLTETLVTPLPSRSALLRALSLGLRLIARIQVFSLFTMSDGTRGSLTLACAVERQDGGAELAAHDIWQQRATLGHGTELDRHVLDDCATCWAGNCVALPLVSPEMGLVGVLVAEEREKTHTRERQPLLDVLAHCLTVLIERLLRDEVADRRERALSALGDLAALSPQRADDAPEAEEWARDAALLAAADILRELAVPLASVALVPAANGALRMAGAPADAPPQLDPARGAELLGALHGQAALVVSDEHASGIWDDLTALREQAYEQTGRQVARMTLLPIWVEEEIAGILTLALARSAFAERYWMPAATAIASATGAGIRAQRLAEVAAEEGRTRDEFISLAAHELRSPLTSVKGYAQLLARQARKTTVPETMLRSVEAIEQQSLRMSEMVGELLDASRIRRGMLDVQLGATDLVAQARKVVEKRQSLYPRHKIALRTEEPSLTGAWDAQRVEQILRDLLDNAARYSPAGGAITIRLASVEGMALLSIRDEGIGIAAEERDRVFDYLYRSPSAEERNLSGLGLGLYISSHLAERMGGRLTLRETSTGKAHGSEFQLLLPLAG